MLNIVTANGLVPLRFDKYWIQEETNGKDSFGLTIPLDDEQYPLIAEEVEAIDAETGLRYVFRQIDEGAQTAACKGVLCLDELKAEIFIGYNSDTHRAAEIVAGIIPENWTVIDRSGVTLRRTVTLEGGTALDIIDAVCKMFSICVRYNNRDRTITLISPKNYTPSGTYLTDELNLKTCNYKGSSKDFATRLYMRGKDGCTFAEINDGKDYVEDHTYSDKVVSTVWIDERYTVKEEMLAAAKAKLHELAVPVRSYECDVIDLARAKSSGAANIYSHLDFSLFSVATLLDRRRNRRVDHQVVRLKRFPGYPEQNVVTLSTVAVTVQSKLNTAYTEVTSPNSNFKGTVQSLLDSLAKSVSEYDGGNLEITKNANGKPNGLRIMDTDDKATATRAMWLNLNGIAYSDSGIDGPYSSVWSFEKSGFIADWIVAGNLSADLITTGKLQDKSGNFLLDLSNGIVKINAEQLTVGSSGVATSDALQNSITLLQSSISSTAEQIELNVSKTYATKNSLSDYTKTNEIRSKFAMDPTNISIESGVISFKSNTITIESDNFNLTGNGEVSAKGTFISIGKYGTSKLYGGNIEFEALKAFTSRISGGAGIEGSNMWPILTLNTDGLHLLGAREIFINTAKLKVQDGYNGTAYLGQSVTKSFISSIETTTTSFTCMTDFHAEGNGYAWNNTTYTIPHISRYTIASMRFIGGVMVTA